MPRHGLDPIREAVCAITGDIVLEIIPPDEFTITPKVKVNGSDVDVKLVEGDPKHRTWRYFALTKTGKTTIACTLMNVESSTDVEARAGHELKQDFVFGQSKSGSLFGDAETGT